uniref:Uncharacterized protein n=1 Tax=Parascaris equorum TaxID=6256 RepID=A0A914R9Y8_PAREQ
MATFTLKSSHILMSLMAAETTVFMGGGVKKMQLQLNLSLSLLGKEIFPNVFEMGTVAACPSYRGSISRGESRSRTMEEKREIFSRAVIDQVHRYRHTHIAVHPKDGDRDIKAVIGELAEMRYHLATDKPLRNFDDDLDDISIWNEQLEFLRKMVSSYYPS